MEKRFEWSRFYLAEVSEADEIPYNRHGVVDERRDLVEGIHAEIEGVCRGTIGADGKGTLTLNTRTRGRIHLFWKEGK